MVQYIEIGPLKLDESRNTMKGVNEYGAKRPPRGDVFIKIKYNIWSIWIILFGQRNQYFLKKNQFKSENKTRNCQRRFAPHKKAFCPNGGAKRLIFEKYKFCNTAITSYFQIKVSSL